MKNFNIEFLSCLLRLQRLVTIKDRSYLGPFASFKEILKTKLAKGRKYGVLPVYCFMSEDRYSLSVHQNWKQEFISITVSVT